MKRIITAVIAATFFAAPATSQTDKEGFTKLFNGKDLTGWRYPGRKGKPVDGKSQTPDGRIVVKDATIVMLKGRGIRDLYTQKEFSNDFILSVEFRAGKRADSGVHIRGKQVQIRDFIRRGERKHLKKFKTDGWNKLVITVKGKVATSTINGEKLGKMNVPANGPIGLQAESGVFEYRNVRVKVE